MGWSIGGQAPLMKCHLSSLLLFDTDGELPYPRPLHMRKKGIDKLYSTPMMTYDECGRYPVERSANRRHSRRLWIELGQREHSSGGEASAADGKPQAFHVSQVVISSACADRPGEAGLPSRQRLARLQLLRPSPKE